MWLQCQALAEVLKHNRSITNIDLRYNQIGEVGAEAGSLPGVKPCHRKRDAGLGCFRDSGPGRGGAGERRHPRDRPSWKSIDGRFRTRGAGGTGQTRVRAGLSVWPRRWSESRSVARQIKLPQRCRVGCRWRGEDGRRLQDLKVQPSPVEGSQAPSFVWITGVKLC